MKALIAVKTGRWRIIPGNHSNDLVQVELPLADIGSPNATGGERKGQTTPRTDTDTLAAALQSVKDRITELTDQLTAEKDRHRETAVELEKATTKGDFLEAELSVLMSEADDLHDDLIKARRSWC